MKDRSFFFFVGFFLFSLGPSPIYNYELQIFC